MTLARQHNLLQRIQTTLPHKDAVQHINDIIDRPDAQAYIEKMDSVTLFRLIKSAGFDQGVDLIPYATPEQVQAFVDFDVWRRDRMLVERFHRWLDAVIDGKVPKRFTQVLRDLDPEVIALYVKKGLKVELVEEGQIPEHMPMNTEKSPDGVYAIIYPEDETYAVVLRKLIRRLFEEDRVLAWTLLEAARWEMASEMEEFAYRWRQGRLEEEGFVPRDEAMAIYRPIDPLRLRTNLEAQHVQAKPALHTPEAINLPSVMTSEFAGDYYILDILDALDDDQQIQELVFEMTNVCNRTMVADGIEPGELSSGRQVVRRTLGYMSVGLMFLSHGDDAQASAALQTLPMRDILRTGYTMASRLQHQAQQLAQRPTLTLTDETAYSLLNPAEEALVESLSRQRPTFASSAVDFDIFRHQQQIDDAALALGQIAFKQLWLFGIQRQSINSLAELLYNQDVIQDPAMVTFDMCFTTAVARTLLGLTPSIEPLTRKELGEFLVAIKAQDWDVREDIFEAFKAQLPESIVQTTQALLMRWISLTMLTLQEELGQAHGELEHHVAIITERILMRTDV